MPTRLRIRIPNQRRRRRRRGFTIVELLVVLAVIGLLSALLLPALARSKSTSRLATCLNNIKQLQLAWLSYAHDNDDRLPTNRVERREFDLVAPSGSWVVGNAKLDPDDTGLRVGQLWPHAGGNAGIYRCPSDNSTVQDRPGMPRNRSYSANFWLNSEVKTGTAADQINGDELNLLRLSQVSAQGASRVFVFIDEEAASIDEGAFMIGNPAFATTPPFWVSFPAERHDGKGTLSYADGHVEAHRWQGSRAKLTYTTGKLVIPSSDIGGLADWGWIQDRLPD